MKILQVNCVYKKGSTGKITADIHQELLEQGIESVVCYGRGAVIREPNVYKTCGELYSKANNLLSRFTGLMYGGCFFSTNKLISIIKKERPDIVHLQCINGYFVNIFRLVAWLKKHKVKTVLTLHAEFMFTANCGYALECGKWRTGCGHCPSRKQETKSLLLDRTATAWKRMKQAFDGFDSAVIVGVSNWITNSAKQSQILGGLPSMCIYNGIRIDNFHADRSEAENRALREKYGIPEGKRIVLQVTPGLNHVKGGDIFLRLAQRLPEDYHAVVVGQGGDYSDRVTAIPFTNNQQELAGLYRMADVMVSTSRSDNYPTVCLEANCCGTPVVGFDVGGVKETIGQGLGQTVPALDEDALLHAVLEWSKRKLDISQELVAARRTYCDRKRMANDYVQLYRQMLKQ